jgi:hypothetical protein
MIGVRVIEFAEDVHGLDPGVMGAGAVTSGDVCVAEADQGFGRRDVLTEVAVQLQRLPIAEDGLLMVATTLRIHGRQQPLQAVPPRITQITGAAFVRPRGTTGGRTPRRKRRADPGMTTAQT